MRFLTCRNIHPLARIAALRLVVSAGPNRRASEFPVSHSTLDQVTSDFRKDLIIVALIVGLSVLTTAGL